MGYSTWGRKESDTTERLSTAQHSTYLPTDYFGRSAVKLLLEYGWL